MEYASFSQQLCEDNSDAEGIHNTEFHQGNACKLDYPDEYFDSVTSNYVYHNIAGVNKQELLSETLRVLKKGGTFAIHDIMSKARYGDMQQFIGELYDDGYYSCIFDLCGDMAMYPACIKAVDHTQSYIPDDRHACGQKSISEAADDRIYGNWLYRLFSFTADSIIKKGTKYVFGFFDIRTARRFALLCGRCSVRPERQRKPKTRHFQKY